ncbi:helix-turn-helix transcriptional regulator [Actinomarinicola tropica]|uniref:WYL domain-containing protein n=1 Tax=Actinomarinicola tropica TaxID=2789776 RepID=A0A5Q2RQL5_9ACTN|nr:YafY family protein [Actinomarinicola tropica]QGG96851.1 WYL domain-containing protein [Actinomarinicola tropica]
MRASRLIALLLRLQHQGPTTAARLAEELEVSVRTIYRDVAGLQQAGVPIWTETGPGGGIRLLDGWQGRIDGLTADEASALMLSGAPAAAAELGLGSVVAAAQAKVMATLPPELRSRAGRVRERFLLDAPGWFHRDEPTTHLDVVADAVWSEARLDVRYGRQDREVRRRIDPLGLVLKGGAWYVVAAHRGQVRTYRLARVVSVRRLDETFVRPADFDLAGWWGASSTEFELSLLRERIELRVDAVGARLLPAHVGHAAAEPALAAAPPPDAHGWRTVELPVESLEVAAHQLTSLGEHVEVVAPPALRSEMARIGRAMAVRHGG